MEQFQKYYVADLSSRQQIALHYKSSLDQPTLQNVQVKLLATRQRNHQLALQYFKNKYGETSKYQPYAEMYRAEGVKEKDDFQAELDRKAEEIRRTQMDKIRKKALGIEVPEDEKKQNNKKNKQNPWLTHQQQPKNQSPNHKNVKIDDNVYEFVDKVAKMENSDAAFISGFKSYMMNKSKVNNQSDIKKKNMEKSNGSYINQKQTKSGKKTSHEEQLAKKIYKDILGQVNIKSIVLKGQLINYLTKNKRIITVLGLNQTSAKDQIINYKTKNSQHISYKQFVLLILKFLGKQEQRKDFELNWRQTAIPKGCMLTEENIATFETIFKKMDRYKDLIVQRIPFISQIATENSIKKILNMPAVFEPQFERAVSLRRVFERIQLQCLAGNEQEKKSKQYISWEQFMSYLESGHNDRRRYNMITLVESLQKQQKFGLQLIPQSIYQILTRSIENLEKGKDYFETFKLIQQIQDDYQYNQEKYTMARVENCAQTELQMETFQEIITRIKEEGSKYMNVKEFLQYFSIRGKPIDQINAPQTAKTSQKIIQTSFREPQEINGYDSDPEMYSSNIHKPHKKRHQSPQRSKAETIRFFKNESQNPNDKGFNKKYKITVPLPFKFQERDKQLLERKKNRSHLQRAQSLNQFKAKQPPQSVKPGLYEKMLQEDKKRQQERRKNCMLMTLANQNPFNFTQSKPKKKTHQQRQQFIFKAEEIPWYCSRPLLKKIEEKDILRKQKIAKLAQYNLAKAKLPPRMEKNYQQKLANKIKQQQNKQNNNAIQKEIKSYSPPDFQKLHKEFQEKLQKKKKQNKTTQIIPFNFVKVQIKEKKLSVEDKQILSKSYSSPKNYSVMPPANSTAKFNQFVAKRRKQMEEKAKKQQKKLKQDEQRKKIDKKLQEKVIKMAKIKKIDETQEREKRRQQMKEQNKKYQQFKQNIIQRARNQPSLIERPLKRDEKIQKMKKLYTISKSLKSHGIKGKDHDSYFKKEELLLLQDYQMLKDQL